jgi:phosphomethylpyrimidine synthase
MKISQEVREFAANNPNGVLGSGDDLAPAEAEAGMKEMSKVFKETGSELYMGQGDREHD